MNIPSVGAPVAASPLHASSLPYGKRHVRYALASGQPIFAAADISTIARVPLGPGFTGDWTPGHYLPGALLDDKTGQPIDAVTIVGAETIASRAKFPGSRIVTGYIRNQASRLMLDAHGKPQRPPLTLLADAAIPPEPQRGTADWKSWCELNAGAAAALQDN